MIHDSALLSCKSVASLDKGAPSPALRADPVLLPISEWILACLGVYQEFSFQIRLLVWKDVEQRVKGCMCTYVLDRLRYTDLCNPVMTLSR